MLAWCLALNACPARCDDTRCHEIAGDVFDNTMSYPGEGPPSGRSHGAAFRMVQVDEAAGGWMRLGPFQGPTEAPQVPGTQRVRLLLDRLIGRRRELTMYFASVTS